MRVFKTRFFCKWAAKNGIDDRDIKKIVTEIEDDQIDANLGGFIFKKRISVNNQSKRDGARVIFAYHYRDLIFFLDGYKKNEREDFDAVEIQSFRYLGKYFLSSTDDGLDRLLITNRLFEVQYG